MVLNDGSQRGAINFIAPNLKSQTQPAPQFIDPTTALTVNVGGSTLQLQPKKVIDPILQ